MLYRGRQPSQGKTSRTSTGAEVLRGMAVLTPTDSLALSRPVHLRMQGSLEVRRGCCF